jgi:predicted RNase H-like nuclease (RuvC/YqgF family)
LKEAAKTISSGYDLRTKDGQKYREDHSNIINLNSMTRRYDEDISYQKGELKGLDPLSDKYKSIRSNIKHRYNSFIGEYEKAYAEDEEYRRNQSR